MSGPTVTTVDTGPRQVSRRVVVNSAPGPIFALVGDPRRHPELDGSGTVRDVAVKTPDHLGKGAKFTVGMKQYGVPYKITSVVVEYDQDRVFEWRHPGGHHWRWELAELEPGRTQVTETFDYSTSVAPKLLEVFAQPAKNAQGITKTLQALAERFD